MQRMEFVGRELEWTFDPLEALRRWPAQRPVRMLHSGRLHARWSRWSILAEPVGAFRFMELISSSTPGVRPRGHSEWISMGQDSPVHTLRNRPFSDLRALLAATPEALWIGYLAYDLGRWIERLPAIARRDRDWPVIELGWCPGWLAYDAVDKRWLACGTWRERLPIDLAANNPQLGAFEAGSLQAMVNRQQYELVIARAIDYIAAGDIFQVNLAQRMTASIRGDYPLAQRALFDRLASVSPAWYGAYVELAAARGEPRCAIASTSPELFLEMDEAGRIVTRPIKGTRPASVSAEELRQSAKDQAELHMIVDLLRNDMGRVCAYGTIRVDEPRTIETHPTVHHGVATITGRLHEAYDVVDMLHATLPGGSITGAPKVRAMQIIDELEPVRRGPYCGCIGMLSERSCCLNIAIRTLLLESEGGRGRADFSIGGGIVADSKPELEYQETLDKAAVILRTLMLMPPK